MHVQIDFGCGFCWENGGAVEEVGIKNTACEILRLVKI